MAERAWREWRERRNSLGIQPRVRGVTLHSHVRYTESPLYGDTADQETVSAEREERE